MSSCKASSSRCMVDDYGAAGQGVEETMAAVAHPSSEASEKVTLGDAIDRGP